MSPPHISLKEVALLLDVHYMTAYRYMREGHLPAAKVGREWMVRKANLAAFQKGRLVAKTPKGGGRKQAPWAPRMTALLIKGEERSVLALMESVLRSGNDLQFLYFDVVTPAMVEIGRLWQTGQLDVFVEHRASGIVDRTAARIGARFSTSGVRKGTLLIGAPQGEMHVLSNGLLADLLQQAGWKVDNLGADVPIQSMVAAAEKIPDLVGICLSISMTQNFPALNQTIAEIKQSSASHLPIFVGGAAVKDKASAAQLHACHIVKNLPELLALLHQQARRR